ncbi:MAG: hypothetical protein LAO78_12595 [Acidobacteriia bacterium]|nr:hypothetical protein [Terriglobia bacterium]
MPQSLELRYLDSWPATVLFITPDTVVVKSIPSCIRIIRNIGYAED